MAHDLMDALEPLGRLLPEQALQQVLEEGGQAVLHVLRLVVDNALVDLVVVLVEVGREADYQLVQESAQAVDVGASVVAVALEDFGAHVFWGAAEGIAFLAFWDFLGETEIGDFDVAIDIDEDIFWLDVSVDDVQAMQMLKAEKELSHVELGLLFSKLLDFSKMEEHLTSSAEVHYKEKFSFALKRPIQLDDERMIKFLHDLSFNLNLLNFLTFQKLILAHDFHGIQASSILFSDQDDSAEGSSANDLKLLEIVSCNLELLCIWSKSQFCKVCSEVLSVLEDIQ